MIDGFNFLRPWWLLLLPVVLFLAWCCYRRQSAVSTWQSHCDPALLAAQIDAQAASRPWLPFAILGFGWVVAIFALSGPVWQQQAVPVYSELSSRIILFDLSQSMDSNDLVPSRLSRARYKLNDLVSGAGARQQALVVFAGDSFVVSPFTDDQDTLINMIPALDTATMPVQGSRPDRGLMEAQRLIANAAVERVQIVIITDGANRESVTAAGQLAKSGHRVHVIAVGTREGAPIPLADGGLLKNSVGDIVVPSVDHEMLRRLAEAGNGRYFDLSAGDDNIAWLNRSEILQGSGDAVLQREVVAGSGGTLRWLDGGIWLLLPLALLASLGFRRGALIVLVLAALQPARPAMAFEWDQLWLTPDQRAANAIAHNQPDAVPPAAAPGWRGAAAYRQEDFDAAAAAFSNGETAMNRYNLGNTLAKSGKLDEAIEAYDHALEIDPQMEDARFNRDLVERLRQQQQSQQQRSGENGDSSGNEESTSPESPERQSPDEDRAGENQEPGREQGDQQEQGAGAETDPGEDQFEQNDQEADPDSGEDQQEELSADEQSDTRPATPADQPGPTMDEDQQALQQWLKQVPDDPGGLLRRKFRYQYSQRERRPAEALKW